MVFVYIWLDVLLKLHCLKFIRVASYYLYETKARIEPVFFLPRWISWVGIRHRGINKVIIRLIERKFTYYLCLKILTKNIMWWPFVLALNPICTKVIYIEFKIKIWFYKIDNEITCDGYFISYRSCEFLIALNVT
jgi:hypothetical protein